MKNTIILLIMLLSFIGYSAAQSSPETEKKNSTDQMISLSKEAKKNLSISFIFDQDGNASLITIKPTESVSKEIPLKITERERMMYVIDNLVPPSDRGKKLGEDTISLGRAYILSFKYENLSINLTNACQDEVCGISYAEIRFR